MLEGLDRVWNNAEKRQVVGYKVVIMAWSNGVVTIPLDFRYWHKDMGKTKLELAQEMLTEWREKIQVDMVLMDGLYSSNEMMKFLDRLEVFFIMRLPKNRKVQKRRGELNAQIEDHWQFRLQRNARTGFFRGIINGKWRSIIANKRRAQNGNYRTVFLVTNLRDAAKDILSTYSVRWNIEKFFRTAKHKLGLQDCQARALDRQSVHILACLASYAIIETIRLFYDYYNADQVIRLIRSKKNDTILCETEIWRIFCAQA